MRSNKLLTGALSAITAAVAGVILNLAVWFAVHSLFRATHRISTFGLRIDVPVPNSIDPWHLALVVAAMLAVLWFRIGVITTLAACGVAGVALYASGLTA